MSEPSIETRFYSAVFSKLLYKVRRRHQMYGANAFEVLTFMRDESDKPMFTRLIQNVCNKCGLQDASLEALSDYVRMTCKHAEFETTSLMGLIDEAFDLEVKCLLQCDVTFEQAERGFINRASRLNPFESHFLMQGASRHQIVSMDEFGLFIFDYDKSGLKYFDIGISDVEHGLKLVNAWCGIEREQWHAG